MIQKHLIMIGDFHSPAQNSTEDTKSIFKWAKQNNVEIIGLKGDIIDNKSVYSTPTKSITQEMIEYTNFLKFIQKVSLNEFFKRTFQPHSEFNATYEKSNKD